MSAAPTKHREACVRRITAALDVRHARGLGDPRALACVRDLTARGGPALPHALGRSLQDHLVGTWRILALWGQPARTHRAGLVHSGYATQAYPAALFAPGARAAVRALVGRAAEARAHWFCTLDRRGLVRAVETRGIPVAGLGAADFRTGERHRLAPDLVADLMVIEMANLAEQSARADGAPAPWMSACARWGRAARPRLRVVPPVFDRCTATLTDADERAAIEHYTRAAGGPGAPGDLATLDAALRRASALNPWAAEPRILLAEVALAGGDRDRAWVEADRAVALLLGWGTAWDKRRSWWRWLAMALEDRARAERGLRGRTQAAKRDARAATLARGASAREAVDARAAQP